MENYSAMIRSTFEMGSVKDAELLFETCIKNAFPTNTFRRLSAINISNKTQALVIQVYVFVGRLAGSDPTAGDFPDRIAVFSACFDLEYMVPAASFHILIIPGKPNQLQTPEGVGRKCIFDTCLK